MAARGVTAGLTNRIRMAVVSSRFVPTLRLDATQPLDEIVGALNHFPPRLADRLRVDPPDPPDDDAETARSRSERSHSSQPLTRPAQGLAENDSDTVGGAVVDERDRGATAR